MGCDGSGGVTDECSSISVETIDGMLKEVRAWRAIDCLVYIIQTFFVCIQCIIHFISIRTSWHVRLFVMYMLEVYKKFTSWSVAITATTRSCTYLYYVFV
jgi:hypothetical protein